MLQSLSESAATRRPAHTPAAAPISDPPDATQICGIVVTYHPDDASLRCLCMVEKTLAHTIVVDNASGEASRQLLRTLDPARFTLIENADNAGVGTALNQGIRAAHQRGYRWFLLLDQDTRLLPSTLPGLIDVVRDCQRELGDSLGLIGCNYFHQWADGTVQRAQVRFTQDKLWHHEDHVITAGTLISWRSYEAIGSFREDFFIDQIDHEYCLRAQVKKLAVIRTALPLMVHRIGMVAKRRSWLKLGGKRTSAGYSPLRRYYQVRNYLVMVREYGAIFPQFIAGQRVHIRKEVKRALLYETRWLENLRAIFLALRHSQRGQLGKLGDQPAPRARGPVSLSASAP